MGLPSGWVTDSAHHDVMNQQVTALGNGVLSLQAFLALKCLSRCRLDGAVWLAR